MHVLTHFFHLTGHALARLAHPPLLQLCVSLLIIFVVLGVALLTRRRRILLAEERVRREEAERFFHAMRLASRRELEKYVPPDWPYRDSPPYRSSSPHSSSGSDRSMLS
jgi:hypothetical protein